MTTIDIPTILDTFAHFEEGVYPREAVEASLTQREEITPHLIQILEDLVANLVMPDKADWRHMYAMLLLGHFEETTAHQVILDVFSLPRDLVEGIFSDSISEDLPGVLIKTCSGSVEGIKNLVLNRDAYEYCRGAALTALEFAVVKGYITREDVLDFTSGLFTGEEAEAKSAFWSFVTSTIVNLHPAGHEAVLKQAFADELIDRTFIGWDSVEETLIKSPDQILAEVEKTLQHHYHDNFHDSMSWWYSFQSDEDGMDFFSTPASQMKPVSQPDTRFDSPNTLSNTKAMAKKKKKRKWQKPLKRKIGARRSSQVAK